jgi:hypothetical protein
MMIFGRFIQVARAICKEMLTKYPPIKPADILAKRCHFECVKYLELAGIYIFISSKTENTRAIHKVE